MTFTERCMPIFDQAIVDYHKIDDVDQPINNPYEQGAGACKPVLGRTE